MRIGPSTTALQLAQLYGVGGPGAVRRPVAPPAPQALTGVAGASAADRASGVRDLVALRVPGGIDFSGIEPAPKGPALPLYRHPADKNAAATGLAAGGLLDELA